MPCVLLALAAALLAPLAPAHGAATTQGPGYALASPGAGNISASPAAGVAGRPAPSLPPTSEPDLEPDVEPDLEPQPEPHLQAVMVDAPRRRFANIRRCDVGYSWIRGICRRIFGSPAPTPLAT